MSIIALVVILAIMLVYLDFAIWYSAEISKIWDGKKWKFRGVLFKLWDWIGNN